MKWPGPRLALVVSTSVLLLVPVAAAAPAPNEPVPRDPAALARMLETTTNQLGAAIDRWHPKSVPAPDDVVLLALYQQRIYRALGANAKLSRTTIRLLPRGLAAVAADLLAAHRELYRLTPPLTTHKIKVGPALPASALLSAYREAQRRFKVPWEVLAAVNFVESKFGKLRNASAAEVAEFESVSVRGFENEGATIASGAIHPPSILGDPRMEMFLGRVDGRPVGAAMGYRTDDAIGVFGVTVVASARRRGYGTVLTCAAMSPESRLPSVLAPSPEGAPLYAKLSFARVGDLSIRSESPTPGLDL